ncbi:hypothetical protein VNI00_003478 [Paramarasmius palmivorus]|uniref:Uncharacterized protein n=1 Tax=Paramarasmius palmivorus TaxID=297713 RepID=A0AAW0DTH3_9AGAR
MASTLPDNYLPFFSVQEALIRHVATLSLGVFGGFTDKSVLRVATQAISLFSKFSDSCEMGIAPTLIMVRAKLGQNIESLQEAVSDIRFTSQPARQGTGGINLSTTQSEAQVLSIVRNSSVFEGGEEDAQNVKEASGLREGARRQT